MPSSSSLSRTFPITLACYCGRDLDEESSPAVVTFRRPEELEAYVMGLNEAEGWMGHQVVAHGHFRVNAEGEVKEQRKGRSPSDTPNGSFDAYVLWGEKPEKGSKPSKYEFFSASERDAFLSAVDNQVGWTSYAWAPSEAFKPFMPSTPDPKDMEAEFLARIAPEHQAYVRQRLADDHYPLACGDCVFVRSDGAFVRSDWSPYDRICDEPMSATTWYSKFSNALNDGYPEGSNTLFKVYELEKLRQRDERNPEQVALAYGSEQGWAFAPKPKRTLKS
jgi:hypothetical protein